MSQPNRYWTERYWDSFRLNAHKLISWGYQDRIEEIVVAREETDITGLNSEAIDDRLSSPSRPNWCAQISIKEDNPVPGRGRRGRSRKRPDIILQSKKIGHPEFIFEAKRLHKKNHREIKYISNDGLMCFINGSYAERFIEGCMLGYVQSENTPYWKGRIQQIIQNDPKGNLRLNGLQHNKLIIPDFSDEWVSEHDRIDGKRILVYHILLDCTISALQSSLNLVVLDDSS